jgi:hypothetical protein
MMTVQEVKDWLNTLPPNHRVAVDDGGLTLICLEDVHPYLELGGMPLEEDMDAEDLRLYREARTPKEPA